MTFETETQAVFDDDVDAQRGIYGPDSTTWRISREVILFLGGGRAALLQLAHPFVAHAIDQHSQTRADPVGRFDRTFRSVYAMIFGDLAHARGASERVRRIHEHIAGTIDEEVGAFGPGDRYLANDAMALLWVHATIIDSAVLVYEATVGPLSPADKDRYWEESKRFVRLFGVPAGSLPGRWADFQRWFYQTLASDVIAVGRPARALGSFLMTAPKASAVPVLAWYRTMTAGFMPPSLRAPYGLAYGSRHRLLHRSSLRALRALYPTLPRRLRDVPAYVEARRRLVGDEGPDHFGRRLERLALRVVAPPERRAR